MCEGRKEGRHVSCERGGVPHMKGEEVQGRQVSSEGGEACLM